MKNEQLLAVAKLFLRLALAASFLVAVGDRIGVFGPPGARNVAWGEWSRFVKYVGILNWFAPKALIPWLAVLETVIECGLGVALVLGVHQREVAWASAALLTSFAITMSVALGVLAPLSYSVFTAVGAALLLGVVSAGDSTRSGAPHCALR